MPEIKTDAANLTRKTNTEKYTVCNTVDELEVKVNCKKNMENTDKAAHGSGTKYIKTQEYLVVHGQEPNKLNVKNITK